MDYAKISKQIQTAILNRPRDVVAYEDLFSLCRQWAAEDFTRAHDTNKQLRGSAAAALRVCTPNESEKFYSVWRKTLLFDAPYDFDSYMRYIELDAKPERRFYAPRREYLMPMVRGYQDLMDGRLRLLTISMPKKGWKITDWYKFCKHDVGQEPGQVYADGGDRRRSGEILLQWMPGISVYPDGLSIL